MLDLNNSEAVRKIDPQDTLGSTDLLVKQCEVVWKESYDIDLPDWGDFTPKNVVFCGMGASIYGALVIKSLLGRNLPCPFETVSDYHIPSFVNSSSLVILVSYSGNTEEVLSCAEDALSQGAKILIITKGGKLKDFAEKHDVLSYIFDGKLNPAGIPRLGNGYTIVSLLAILNRLGIITIEIQDIENALTRLHEKRDTLKANALTLSEQLLGKAPVIIGAEHLSGNTHILRNQFHETSKTFATHFLIPDLNHHLMEGLKFPEENPLIFLMLESKNYAEKITKRIELSKDVIKQNDYDIIEFETSAQTVYDDFLEGMVFGSYLTLFLGLRYDQNPAINPFVDSFKEKLSE